MQRLDNQINHDKRSVISTSDNQICNSINNNTFASRLYYLLWNFAECI